jgi:hypothetical protein
MVLPLYVLYRFVFWHGEAESLEGNLSPAGSSDPPPESLAGGFFVSWHDF